MDRTKRRTFLGQAAAGAAGLALSVAPRSRAADTRSESVLNIALVGAGGMGSGHLRALAGRKDVRVAYVCDVDRDRFAAAAKIVESGSGKAPEAVGDMRRVYDDKAVEAVFIATPDHWHAPAALLALDAGKHVYVEKPMCHNIREGQLLVDAVARTGKCLQVGTQSRSTPFVREAIDRVLGGEIGEVIVAKAWNSQRRGSIGHTSPGQPPANLDFDGWLGPAPVTQYRTNLLHGVWRWWYDFGCGDIGNDGVHDIDVALWGLGAKAHPATVACLGGKHFFDDDQQFPDTQYAVFEYEPFKPDGRKRQLIFEQRIWSPYPQEGYDNGAAFYGTNGVMILGHSVGWRLYGPRNKLIAEKTGAVDLNAHHTNFFDCIRGRQKELAADAAAGHRAATIVHLANIAARVGRLLEFDGEKQEIRDDGEANALVARQYREHWARPKGA